MIFNKLYNSIANNKKQVIDEVHTNRILNGRLLAEINNQKKSINKLEDVEFKVFSQWNDDGIIQYLIHHTEIPYKTFVEFGVENYTEANTRFLLLNNNWSGLIMDGSEENIDYVKNDPIYWKYDLQCKAKFITVENVNELIASAGFSEELGILHIDIDGNDYWIWKAVNVVNPIIVIVEYNAIFGFDKPFTTPYDPTFYRTNYHYSNLLYGTSLLSICDLADEKGYDFIGCNSSGNNAYFIRKDKSQNFKKLSAEQGFSEAKFKESRDKNGHLTFLRYNEKVKSLSGEQVYNTRTKKLETI